MKKFKFNIQGKAYEVEILKVEDNMAELNVNGSLISVEVDSALIQSKTPTLVRTQAVPSSDSNPSTVKTHHPNAPKGSGNIKAPLPGTILGIYVKAGDQVVIGQKLIVLEAMKMENNINSDKEGKVTEIKVNKGDSVMEGDVLIVIG